MLPLNFFYWFRKYNKHMIWTLIGSGANGLGIQEYSLDLDIHLWYFYFKDQCLISLFQVFLHARNRLKIKLICRLSKDLDQALISISRLKKTIIIPQFYGCYCKFHLFKLTNLYSVVGVYCCSSHPFRVLYQGFSSKLFLVKF